MLELFIALYRIHNINYEIKTIWWYALSVSWEIRQQCHLVDIYISYNLRYVSRTNQDHYNHRDLGSQKEALHLLWHVTVCTFRRSGGR